MNKYFKEEAICKEVLYKTNIEHRLEQIARHGHYYLDDLSFVEYIPVDDLSSEEYDKILEEYGLKDFMGLKQDCCIIERQNSMGDYYYSSEDYSSWDPFGLSNLLKSSHSYTCGWELYSEEMNMEYHYWLQEKIEENNLPNDLYTLSVDSLDNPKKVFIHNEDSQLFLTIDL